MQLHNPLHKLSTIAAMSTLLMLTSPPLNPFSRSPAYLSKKGWGFAFVVLLHIVLIVLLEQVLEHASHSNLAQVVTAQLVSEFHEPEPPKPELPQPKLKTPLPLQPAPPIAPIPVTAMPSNAPAITVTPAAALPAAVAPATTAVRAPEVIAPVRIASSCEKPPYPASSQRLREQGVVTLKFLISESGQVLSGQVENSSGYKRLDEAALAGLSLCKFKPATVDGKPKQEWSAMRYRWELAD